MQHANAPPIRFEGALAQELTWDGQKQRQGGRERERERERELTAMSIEVADCAEFVKWKLNTE